MQVVLIVASDSQTDYSRLSVQSPDLILIPKTPTELVLEEKSYDFLIIEQKAIGKDVHHLKEKISLERVFLILEESKAELLDTYLSLGVRDIFIQPINFTELSIKLKHSADLQRNELFANAKLGMSLKQILIFEVLKMCGPQGASRNQILEKIWGNEKVEPKNVDVHIHCLRKILRGQGKEITYWQNRWVLTG